MLKRYLSILIIVCLSICSVYAQAESNDSQVKVVEAQGIAAFTGRKNKDRQVAIQLAKKNAVEKAIGTLVTSETLVENFQVISDKILTKTSGYIKDFKIISEKKEKDTYVVDIKAWVTLASIKDDLVALNLLQQAMEKPRVLIIAQESVNNILVNPPSSENRVQDIFVRKGFNIIDTHTIDPELRKKMVNIQQMVNIGGDLGAEAIIIVKSLVISQPIAIPGSNMLTCQAQITVKAVKTATGKVLSTKVGAGRAAHIDALKGGAKAIEQGIEKATEELIDDLVKAWNEEILNSQLVQVDIKDIEYGQLVELKEALSDISGVIGVFERKYANKKALLEIDYKGNSQKLAAGISKLKFKSGKIRIIRVQPNAIKLSVVEK